jgi:hypothetical protein
MDIKIGKYLWTPTGYIFEVISVEETYTEYYYYKEDMHKGAPFKNRTKTVIIYLEKELLVLPEEQNLASCKYNILGESIS